MTPMKQTCATPLACVAAVLAAHLVDGLAVVLGRALDQEVARVELEHLAQQLLVGDFLGVHRVAVAAGAGVDADVDALLGAEAVDHAVVEVDELLEHVLVRPGVARVVLVRQPAFGEVDRDAHRAGVEALADVLLDLVAEVVEELLARVALELALERIEEHQHRWRDDGLLDRAGGDRPVLRTNSEANVL